MAAQDLPTPCPSCQGSKGATKSETTIDPATGKSVYRSWWENCSSCQGSGVK